MKQYRSILYISTITLITAQTMHGMDEGSSSALIPVQTGSTSPKSNLSDDFGLDNRLHTLHSPDIHARRNRSRSLLKDEEADDAQGVGAPLHRWPSLTSITAQPDIKSDDFDVNPFSLIYGEKKKEYDAELLNCDIDEEEKKWLSNKEMAVTAVAMGLGTSALFHYRNLNPQHEWDVAYTKFTGLEPIAAIAGLKSIISVGSSLAMPAVVLGSVAYAWHEIKEGIRNGQRVKEQEKIIKTQGVRVHELEDALERIEDAHAHHVQEMTRRLQAREDREYEQLVTLRTILQEISYIPNGRKKANHCDAMLKVINKQALPHLGIIIKEAEDLKRDIKDYIDDEEYAKHHHDKKRSWYNPKRWIACLFRHCRS